MELTRRNFLAGVGLTVAGAVALSEVPKAWADEEPGEEAPAEDAAEDAVDERPIVCEGCPVGCTALVTFEDDRAVAVRGEAANPYSEGRLCLYGQQLLGLREEIDRDTGEMRANPHRLARPRVRRPSSDGWEELSWDMALSEIAAAVKKTRDETFVESIDSVPVMRTEAIASFGGARWLLEEQYLLVKALRGWGVVHLDNEAVFGRRAFAAGAQASFGVEVPDGAWSDVPRSAVILTVGSDHAASQPVTLRWIERAREQGARWVVLDPLRTRTAEMADVHVALRPGTDVAFFGGLVKYIMEGGHWQPEYVLNYTNASYVMGAPLGFDAETGLFSGWDEMSGAYGEAPWAYQTDGLETWNMRFDGEFAWVRGEGVPVWSIPSVPKPVRDITLQYESSAWMQMQAFYGRYDLDTVSTVCGVERETLEAVYKLFAATGLPETAGKIVAGPGLVQHATGAQATRAACVAQLLLGNIGVAGGGIQYTGGVAGEAAADAMGLTSQVFPGGVPWPAQDTPTLQSWLEAVTAPAGTRAQDPKMIVSSLKEWWGSSAGPENDYGFAWLPKRPSATGDASLFTVLASGVPRGCFAWGADVLAQASGGFTARDLAGLEWLVVAEGAPSRTAEFWREVEEGPSSVATTVYQLPMAEGPEKSGMRVSGSRLVQYAEAALPPFEESRTPASLIGELWRRVYNLYDTKGGTAPDPLLNVKWDYGEGGAVDLARVAWALNGYQVEDSDFASDAVALIEGADGLRADGSVACAAGPFAGCWNNGGAPRDAFAQPAGRRDATDESGLGLFSQWGFAWPRNVRVRGNRASANLAGQPWSNDRNLLYWDGQTWVMTDQADFPALREGRWTAPDNCAFPGVWEKVGLLVSDRLSDGPLPEYYEPLESPLNNRLNSTYASPVFLTAAARHASGIEAAQAAASDEQEAAQAEAGQADAGQEADQAAEGADGADAAEGAEPSGEQGTAAEAEGGEGVADARDAALPESGAASELEAVLAPDYNKVLVDREAYPVSAIINGSRADAAATRALSACARAFEPGFFVEVSMELARIRGLETGQQVRVFNERGSLVAPVLVTGRIAPFRCEDSEGHYVCLNGVELVGESDANGASVALGRSWSVLAPPAASPVGGAFDSKGFLVNIEKAEGAA